ncbi:MAG: FAD-dependent oxidoreductase [Candidatus Omnitrophota bacterium]|jgi:UDP-galactopyranose mutase
MSKKKTVILGAGLSGLSAAWHLQKKRIDCLVFEKESEAGGLCRSKRLKGFTFDHDGHLLHFRQRYTFNLVKRLLGDNLLEHKRSSWVYTYDRYIPYPFQANLYGLPPLVAKECLCDFIRAFHQSKPGNKKNLNFYDWINHNFGKGIARHFMIPYNSKFWTVPLKKLTCEWLDGFIPVPSLSRVIEGAGAKNRMPLGYNARFWYPKQGGIASLSRALSGELKNIHTGCRVTEINLKRKEIKTASGDKEKYDVLISTIPLPEIPGLIKDIPREIRLLFGKLKWNSIFNLNLGIERNDLDGKHWIYFPQKETCFFRVGFYHNFSAGLTPRGAGALYVEISYSPEKPIEKKNILGKVKHQLEGVGILENTNSIKAVDMNDIKYGYPIYDNNYHSARKNILKLLKQNGILSCGRYGGWRYMSMENAILEGKKMAEVYIKQ